MAKLSDYFNSTTGRGRANVAKATYAALALIFIYARFIRKKTPKEPKTPEHGALLPSHSHAHDDGSMASKEESACPKCQCGCQCQYAQEAVPNSNINDGHHITTKPNNDNKSVHEAHPAEHVHTHNGQSDENTKASDAKIPTSTILKDIDIQEVLVYEKDKSFTEYDPW